MPEFLFVWFDRLWDIAVFVTPFLIAGVSWWLKSQFITKADFKLAEDEREGAAERAEDKRNAKIDEMITKLASAELQLVTIRADIHQLKENADDEPTRQDLFRHMALLGERMSRIEAAAEGDRRAAMEQQRSTDRQLGVIQNYLQALVERGMRGGGE